MAPEVDNTSSERQIDGNASSAEGININNSPAPKQPGLSSSRPASPQKSPEALLPSPKPFFTSSGTKELTLLAIEKSKRTAWDDEFARRGHKDEEIARQRFAQRRREMEEAKREEETRLAKEEEARLAREEAARLVFWEQKDLPDPVTGSSHQGRPTENDQQGSELEDDELDQLLLETVLNAGSMPGSPAPPKLSPHELEDDELDQLLLESSLYCGSPAGGRAQTKTSSPEVEESEPAQVLLKSAMDGGLMPMGPAQKKTSPPSIFSTRKPTSNAGGFRSRSEGSFEKMMALAHKKVSRRGQDQATRNAAPTESAAKHQATVVASQETDYGDAEWDECDLDGFL